MVISMDRKIVLVACAILLGCLVAMLPYFLYPNSEMEMGAFLKAMNPSEARVPPEFWALREKYSLGNNLIQALVTIFSATALGIVFWLYSKKAI